MLSLCPKKGHDILRKGRKRMLTNQNKQKPALPEPDRSVFPGWGPKIR